MPDLTAAQKRAIHQATIRARHTAATVKHLVAGRADLAYAQMLRSWHEQVRVAGLGYHALAGMPYAAGGPVPGVRS